MTPDKLKKLERLAKVLDGGDIELLTQLNELEERIDNVRTTTEEAIHIAKETKKMKGDDGYTPIKGKDYFDGENYILTAKDKKEIARAITVPVVEKIIEKTVVREIPGETIIREIPIVTNEIKEVATLDDATIAYLEDEIKRVEASIPEKTKETNFGFVIRDVVAGTGVTIDKRDPNRPVVSAVGVGDWTYYATKWDTAPNINTTITGGTVYNYTLDGITRYRFVPTVYDASQDAFYTTFVDLIRVNNQS